MRSKTCTNFLVCCNRDVLLVKLGRRMDRRNHADYMLTTQDENLSYVSYETSKLMLPHVSRAS